MWKGTTRQLHELPFGIRGCGSCFALLQHPIRSVLSIPCSRYPIGISESLLQEGILQWTISILIQHASAATAMTRNPSLLGAERPGGNVLKEADRGCSMLSFSTLQISDSPSKCTNKLTCVFAASHSGRGTAHLEMVERSMTCLLVGRVTGSSISVSISASTNSSGGSCSNVGMYFKLNGFE